MNAHRSLFEPETPTAAGAASVLVADDDPTSRLLVTAALENSFAVTEAENGLLAMEALDRQSFDLAILDLDMPVMDGFGVIERMRARSETRHLPIIVVTGRDDVVAIERAFALGATSFLCKPINWNIFRHQVGYVLQVARMDRETRIAKSRVERIADFRERSTAVLEAEIARAATELSGRDAGAAPSEIAEVGQHLLLVLDRVKRASAVLTGTAASEANPVVAGDLAGAAVEEIRSLLGAPAAQRVILTGDPTLRVKCDRRLATFALVEVLNNALAHSGPDRPVRLGIVEAPSDRVCFEVEDRGAGIPETLLETRFEAFGSERGPDARGRPGLGIPIARAVCEGEGGHFGIISEEGSGTEVFLSFPSAVDLRPGERVLSGTAMDSAPALAEA
jgi:CheY-like chemotaxis protein/two-component sensor histidine kinase